VASADNVCRCAQGHGGSVVLRYDDPGLHPSPAGVVSHVVMCRSCLPHPLMPAVAARWGPTSPVNLA
jgi:hypothetical protein